MPTTRTPLPIRWRAPLPVRRMNSRENESRAHSRPFLVFSSTRVARCEIWRAPCPKEANVDPLGWAWGDRGEEEPVLRLLVFVAVLIVLATPA